jgi:hypothetical protein
MDGGLDLLCASVRIRGYLWYWMVGILLRVVS